MLVAAAVTIGGDKGPIEALGGHVRYDQFAAFLKVLILLGSAAALLMAQSYLDAQDMDRFEYPMLALFATLGMCMMVSANSFRRPLHGARAAKPAALRHGRLPPR